MRAILTFGASLLPFLSATSALHPPGGQTGTTIEVLATGKHEDWPPDFWVSRKGLTIEALEKSGQLKITIAKDAQPGPVLVRLLGQKGISIAHTFVISQQEETLESEPNNHLAEAQKIEKIPALINGRLQKKGDTDFFQFHLKKGETLSAKLDGYSLYSSIDAFLHILDPRGYELAVASDTHNLDPHLVYTARQNGMHTLQVLAVTSKASTSIQYAGDENSVYRLKLSLGKPSSPPPSAEHTELSPTKVLNVPSSLAGIFKLPDETDTYQVKVSKGTSAHIHVEAHSLQFPTDTVLEVYNGEKLIKEVDDEDRNSPDAGYLLKSGTDTPYTLKIRERYGNAGENYKYRLSINEPKPSFEPTIAKDIHEAKLEKKLEIKINLNRKNGHKQPLKVKLSGLPEPICAEGLDIAEDTKEATVSLTIHKDTPKGNHPFQIHISETHEKAFEKTVTRSFQTSESRGDYLINETTWLWLKIPKVKSEEETSTEKK